MSDRILAAINASTPQQEMDALLAKASQLTDMALEMTKLCIDVQNVVPGIALSRKALEMTTLCLDVKGLIPPAFIAAAEAAAKTITTAAAIAAAADEDDPLWVRGVARTPDEMDAMFPAGTGDDIPWQVVCIGREPGLYDSPEKANAQLNGVPNQFRQKKSTRLEALAFYRTRYTAGKVQKWNEVPEDDEADVAANTPATAASVV